MDNKSFAFLAHRVESWNALLDSRLFSYLHKYPQLHWCWIWLAPLYWIVSVISLFTKRGYETVDKFEMAGMSGETILLRNYAWHFLFGKARRIIKKRILAAVLSAQERNQVIGLGALTKAEWLTQGGKWIVDKLGDQLNAVLVHGDTLTAATCLKQLDAIRKKYGIDSPVFMTGATSKIGRANALTLARNKVLVKMFTQGKKGQARVRAIQKEAGVYAQYIELASSLKDGSDCYLWLLGKSKPAGSRLLRAIPKGAVAVNFSVPNPLGENKERPRSDLIVIEGGLLAYDSSVTNLNFTMRLRPGLTYACHAATMVHAYEGWRHHEVTKVDTSQLKFVWQAAERIGFFLPELPEFKLQERKASFWAKLGEVPASIAL